MPKDDLDDLFDAAEAQTRPTSPQPRAHGDVFLNCGRPTKDEIRPDEPVCPTCGSNDLRAHPSGNGRMCYYCGNTAHTYITHYDYQATMRRAADRKLERDFGVGQVERPKSRNTVASTHADVARRTIASAIEYMGLDWVILEALKLSGDEETADHASILSAILHPKA